MVLTQQRHLDAPLPSPRGVSSGIILLRGSSLGFGTGPRCRRGVEDERLDKDEAYRALRSWTCATFVGGMVVLAGKWETLKINWDHYGEGWGMEEKVEEDRGQARRASEMRRFMTGF